METYLHLQAFQGINGKYYCRKPRSNWLVGNQNLQWRGALLEATLPGGPLKLLPNNYWMKLSDGRIINLDKAEMTKLTDILVEINKHMTDENNNNVKSIPVTHAINKGTIVSTFDATLSPSLAKILTNGNQNLTQGVEYKFHLPMNNLYLMANSLVAQTSNVAINGNYGLPLLRNIQLPEANFAEKNWPRFNNLAFNKQYVNLSMEEGEVIELLFLDGNMHPVTFASSESHAIYLTLHLSAVYKL